VAEYLPGRRLAEGDTSATIRLRATRFPRLHSYVPTPETLARTHGLRAVAVLLLVIGHYAMRWPEIPGVGPVSLPVHYSIILFFMLAGFLATRSLWREHDICGGVSLKKFFLRKGLKLFPALAVFVLATWLQHRLGGMVVPVERPLSVLTLAGNYYYALALSDESRHITGHLWSIAVGAQFLAVWTVLLKWALSRGAERLAMLGLILVTALVLVLRFSLSYVGTVPERYLYLSTETRIDALALGAFVALELRSGMLAAWLVRALLRPSVQLGLLAALIGSFAADSAYRIGLGLTVDAVITAALMYAVLRDTAHPVGKTLSSRPLRGLSVISFSLFLWHLHGIAFDQFFVLLPFPVRIVAVLCITLLMATFSYLVLERPFRRVAARFVPRPEDEAPARA
jgi:peptidoglycan/LPS O-acetylase OafA/YrhL